MISPHVVTKIVQPSRSRLLLHRSRLVDFLHQQNHRKLIILSASAGYGKTALLVDFAHETTLPICWYQVDASDRDPQVFLDYLIAAIRRPFPDVGERAQALLGGGTGSFDSDLVIGALITDIQENIRDPFVIILDDYQTVAESEAINHIMDSLLLLLPEKAHLILSSRTLPAGLALTRLAVRQEVAALSASELQFTGEEIRRLLYQNYQTSLGPEQTSEIAERCEGWIAGILLTTPILSEGLLQRLAPGPATHENVYRFLATETFLHLSPELQRFLLDSSILIRLDAETCNHVLETRNAADVLHALEDRNLFLIRLDDANQLSYRYHNLFQEFLRQRLRETDPSRWLALNHRAAEFYETRGEFRGQAIRHYLAAEMYTEAAGVIEAIAQSTFDSGHWSVLADWIDALPSKVLEAHPSLIVTRGIVYAEMGKTDQAETAYTEAIKIYEQGGDPVSAAKTVVWRAMLWRLKGRYRDAIEVCQRALETLQQNHAQPEEAHAWRIIGSTHMLLGEFPRCVKELEKSLQLYEALGDQVRVAWLHHDIGTTLRVHGDPQADPHYHQALDFWRRTQNTAGTAITLNSIGVGYHQNGDYSQAINVLEEARTLAHRMGNRRSEAFALASLGDVYRDQGDLPRALELYRQATDLGQHVAGFILTYALIALGETYRLSVDRENAPRYLLQALEVAHTHQSNYEIGLAETALGIWEYTQGQVEEGTRRLGHAVDLLKTTQRDAARARLHLARAFLLQHKDEKAKQPLKAIAEQDSPLKAVAIPFLVADRVQLLPVLRFAVDKKLGRGYFHPALEKVSATRQAAGARTPSGPIIRISAFGATQVAVGERVLTRRDWGTQWVKELFFLALHHSEGLLKEQIVEMIWRDKSAAQAIISFHNAAYRLRRLIPQCLVYEDGVYSLARDLNIEYDVAQFNQLIRRAEETQDELERVEKHEAAIALYRGEFFVESYSDWCLDLRERLRRQYLDALLALARACEQHGDPAKAIGYYQVLIDKDRDREDVYRALMRLQYRTGDRASAVKTYQQCAHVLREQLNIPSPSRDTLALYEKIVNER